MACVAEGRRVIDITSTEEYCRTEPWDLVQHSMRRRMHVYGHVSKEIVKRVSESRQKRTKAEEAAKNEVAPEVTFRVESMKRFRRYIGWTEPRTSERHRLRR